MCSLNILYVPNDQMKLAGNKFMVVIHGKAAQCPIKFELRKMVVMTHWNTIPPLWFLRNPYPFTIIHRNIFCGRNSFFFHSKTGITQKLRWFQCLDIHRMIRTVTAIYFSFSHFRLLWRLSYVKVMPWTLERDSGINKTLAKVNAKCCHLEMEKSK